MSKFSKLLKNPNQFFQDYFDKKVSHKKIGNKNIFLSEKPPIICWHINDWKQDYFRDMFHENELYFLPFNLTNNGFNKHWKEKILSDSKSKILIWGMEYPNYLKNFIEDNNIETEFVEDSFIRSIGLGSNHELPISLNFDKKTLYFNSNKESDLEYLLNTYDFNNDQELITRAKLMRKKLIEYGISKYNQSSSIELDKVYGVKNKKRILVIGQVEEDASIKYGCSKHITNNDLIDLAYLENPDAQIIYKPHPDVLAGKRKMLSNPEEKRDIALIVKESFPASQALETVDHVYTITSQLGFEALMRGITVTAVGMPFYAGWGLTEDKETNDRRAKKLTIDELFAASYILYPKYFDPILKTKLSPEEALDRLIALKKATTSKVLHTADKVSNITTHYLGEKKYFNLIKVCYPDKVFKLIDINLDDKITINRLKALNKNPLINELWIFAINVSKEINNFILSYTGNKLFVSEGLLHSVGDMNKEKSASFIFDKHCMYYNTRERSELEELLNKYDFTNNPKMLEDANQYKTLILKNSISKYNLITSTGTAYETKTRKRVLILTQPVASPKVRLSNPKIFSVLELINLAKSQNSDAEIIVKPHPSQIEDLKIMSTLRKNSDFLLEEDISLAQVLDTVDHVYTISSLGGFEAALRDITVTVLGTPFYAGYGFTNDICDIYRKKNRTVEEVLAIVLMQTDFIDLLLKKKDTFENRLNISSKQLLEISQQNIEDNSNSYNKNILDNVQTIFIQESANTKILQAYFNKHKFVILPNPITNKIFSDEYKDIIKKQKKSIFFCWGFKIKPYIRNYLNSIGTKIVYIEDGFIRSVKLGRSGENPLSIVLDTKTLYFNSTEESDLENLLSTVDFSDKLINRAKKGISRLVDSGISKYNNSQAMDISKIYGQKNKKRILVIGQVEDDASLKYGLLNSMTNNDLVKLAYDENPDAQIIYKPHPDVLAGFRAKGSNPDLVSDIALILTEDISLSSAFNTIDHVYTMTSLSGFEALIRSIKVTTLGCPFYSGWGLTDDRQENLRRNRTLSIEQLFAVVYIIYPKYFDPTSFSSITFEEALSLLENQILLKKIEDFKILGDMKSAINLIDEKTKKRDYNLLLEKSKILIEAKNYTDALKVLDEIVSIFPKAEIYLQIATVARKLGKFSDKIDKNYQIAIIKSQYNLDYIYKYIMYLWEKEPASSYIFNKLNFFIKNVSTKDKLKVGFGKLKVIEAALYSETGEIEKAHTALNIANKIAGNKLYSKYMLLRYNLYRLDNKVFFNDESYKIFKVIIDNQKKLENIILSSHGSICIVGNSPSLIGKKLGEEIDNHEVVVRFNNYSIDYPYSEDYGAKTDIWVRLPFGDYVKKEFSKNIKLNIFTGCNRLSRPYSEWESVLTLVKEGYPIQFFDKNLFYELQSLIGSPPSAGILMAYQIYKILGPLKKDNFYGFSYTDDKLLNTMKENYHYSDNNAFSSDRHDWIKEAEVFRSFLDTENSHITKTRVQVEYERIDNQVNYNNNLDKYSYNKVISISPGLKDYKVFNKNVTLISSKIASMHLDYLNSNGMEGEASRELLSISKDDCILGFGRARTGEIATNLANKIGAKIYLVEYGFISSMNLPSEKQFNFSLVLDDVGIFYDTTRESQIENILLNDLEIESDEYRTRAKHLMTMIDKYHITKYNNSPDIEIDEARNKHKILLIDQTANDNSIILGQCEEYSFEDMLKEALSKADSTVYLKLHPETVAGAKGGNLTTIDEYKHYPNLKIIDQQCNIISLIKQVDEVYVMTSGVGLEALMLGKPVTCFGFPFYAGWGLTTDKVNANNKRKNLTIEALVSAVFFKYTIYFDPISKEPCEAENVLEWIANNKPNILPIKVEER